MIGNSKLIGTSVLTALAASVCCITPVLAVLAGTTGVVSTFSWIEPFRPYLIGLTVLVLAFAWYQKFKPKTEAEIDCDNAICRCNVGLSLLLPYFLFQS